MKKALFIVGPTSSGKTDIASKISKIIPSVLISADSVQVFRGANIISGKDHPDEIQLALIDVVNPTDTFSVSDFLRLSTQIIEKAVNDNKIPIVVGGTGWYADALFSKIETVNIPPDDKLRARLEKLSLEELQKELELRDPARIKRMNNSDVNNRRRLIRAIEISLADVVPDVAPIFKPGEILFVGLNAPMDKLRERIENRVTDRIKLGAFIEAEKLYQEYDKLSSQIKTANGYKQLFSYIRGEISSDEAIENWITSDYQHAKKQLTWFRRNKYINWFDITRKGYEIEIFELINENFPKM